MAKYKVCILLASSLHAGRQASDRFNQIQTDEKAKAAL